MKKRLIIFTIISIFITVFLTAFYKLYDYDILYSLSITFFTISYHFTMRLIVGLILDRIIRNKIDYHKWWFKPKRFEKGLYKFLKVKKWKKVLPTYESSYFDKRIHTYREIVGAMCQAEVVHEVIFVLSYLPIVLGIFFGAFPAFIITSILSSFLDLSYVIIQRYNRPRVIRLIELKDDF